MEDKPNYYAVIPAEVRYDKRLKPNEKLLYGEITALTGANGKCWASNKYFADLYETSEETISRYIKDLAEAGHIEIEYQRNGSIIKNRFLRLIKSSTAIDEKINGTVDENVKENNKSINNKKEETTKEENKLLNYIETAFGRTINPLEFEIMQSWEDTLRTRRAIDQAIKQGGHSIQYVQKILNNQKKETTPAWINKKIENSGEMDPEESEDFQDFIKEFRNEKK